MIKKVAFLLILIFALAFTAFAANGEDLTLKVAVMGPGDELYFWWGHLALIIEDNKTNNSYFFDYGIFDFDQDNFFYNFAFGRLLYCCGISYTDRSLNAYYKTNRDIIIYTLDVPPEKKEEIYNFAMTNILPENKDYYYHHFRDNCSTRIRDIMDTVTEGQFKKQFENKKSEFTLRQHVRRHTYFSPVGDWFLNFLMGQVIDTPITVWDDMFLPSEVGKYIGNFWYTDGSGKLRRLVSSIETLNIARDRPPVLDKPLKQWVRQLCFSLALTVFIGFFFFLYSKNIKAGRVLAGISMSLCAFFFGVFGLLLYFMNLFTNHDYTFQNANMIFCTPLLLVLFPTSIIFAFTRKEKRLLKCDHLIRIIWLLTVLGVFISMIIKIFPKFYQDNLTDQMLMLPLALLFTFQPVGLKEFLYKYFPFLKK